MSASRLCVATPCGGAVYSKKTVLKIRKVEETGGRGDGEKGKSFGTGLVQRAHE